MFCIDKSNRITLTKGDTATMLTQVYDLNDLEYTIKDTDTVTLTVRKTNSSPAVLTKTADAQHFITIFPADTASLDSGTYMYDVQLTTADGYVYTIIPQNYFKLTGEVTYGA